MVLLFCENRYYGALFARLMHGAMTQGGYLSNNASGVLSISVSSAYKSWVEFSTFTALHVLFDIVATRLSHSYQLIPQLLVLTTYTLIRNFLVYSYFFRCDGLTSSTFTDIFFSIHDDDAHFHQSFNRAKDLIWRHDLFNESMTAAGLSGIETGAKLYISNLDYGVSNEDIKELFSEIGQLKRCTVHYDRNGRPSGSAEVFFARRSDAMAALKRYNNVHLDGKAMKIEMVGTNLGLPATPRVNVVGGPNGRGRRTVVMTPEFNQGTSSSFTRIPRWDRGGPQRGRGRGRGRGRVLGRGDRGRGQGRGQGWGRGRGRKQATDKSADQLDKELDTYHAMNTS